MSKNGHRTVEVWLGYTQNAIGCLEGEGGGCVMDAGFTYRVRSCKSPEFFVSHLFQSWLHSKPAYLENFQQKQSNFKHVFAMMGNGFTVAENHEDTGKAVITQFNKNTNK